jgi:hypothetical protein
VCETHGTDCDLRWQVCQEFEVVRASEVERLKARLDETFTLRNPPKQGLRARYWHWRKRAEFFESEVERLQKERDDAVKLASVAIQALPEKDREAAIQAMKDRVASG